MSEDLYYVWSNEHNAWWAPEERGYRANMAEAGTYTREKALAIAERANMYQRGGRELPNEIPVRAIDAHTLNKTREETYRLTRS